VHAEIDFAGHLLFVVFGQRGRDEAHTGRGVREDQGHASATLELAIDSLEATGRATISSYASMT
jgi:hypothetical protein